MSRSERVVDVYIAERCEFTAEFFISALFARVETKVLEEYALSFLQSGDFSLRVGAYYIGCKRNFAA